MEYYWWDISEQHGVTVMPDDVPTTVEELRAALFFFFTFASDHSGEEEDGESG